MNPQPDETLVVMQPDAWLFWAGPLDQLDSLRIAVKYLLKRGLNTNERFSAATLPLAKYQSREFPETVRPRFERIAAARRAVWREYIGGSLFDFTALKRPERKALQDDIFALYEACLLDIGKMGDQDFYELAYPIAEIPSQEKTPPTGTGLSVS
jgi:hypothetical protein